ncbi:tryptophan synthase beta subunit-like PLP-dependent enzyme [Microthyrium microscopicum]|uniref:Tryptophan synthase beta subunit-like PLP-dependent enzyme n=1 Tax=Microthyrium microscopicum TaxID=703497 RepID=A0A6A6UQ42_9PEZI|nr:tryptophan synthase beta subunit-like PLP-dependent enzyme [Microthyrium microscopicum]
MAQIHSNNVFKGPDSVRNYFNPDYQPPLPLVELPSRLNPLRDDNVRIYAKMLTALPAQNVKMLPALNMLLHEPTAASKSIVEASSGSTALSLGMCARVLWGHDDVCAYVTNKKHPDQLRTLRFFGLKVALYGGLAQQEPVDPKGIMCRLRRLAKEDENVCYPGQYNNDDNWKSHMLWTGPQIYQQLPEINVLCTTVGTGGTISGTGLYLKTQKPSVKVVGHFPGFESSQFPWKKAIDVFETVPSVEAYDMSMQMSREGLICGPSSGEALVGLLQYLGKKKGDGTLKELAEESTGEISCVIVCCDLPYQYMDGYFQKLGEEKFPPIINKFLLKCDQDKYDERWEISAQQASHLLVQKTRPKEKIPICRLDGCARKPACNRTKPLRHTVLDIRKDVDFGKAHVRGSVSSPLKNIDEDVTDIFGNPSALYVHWADLQAKVDYEENRLGSKKEKVVVICYDGEVARLTTSILRGRGYTAYSVSGGYKSLRALNTV